MRFSNYESDRIIEFLRKLQIYDDDAFKKLDRVSKIKQIISYTELIVNEIRPFSRKRPLVFVESAAGNPYLSLVINYYLSKIENREIIFHCIDRNVSLMEKASNMAKSLGQDNITFHGTDITRVSIDSSVDVVYSLHACNDATDRTMYLGNRLKARRIFSVSCCQQDAIRNLRSPTLQTLTKHGVFRERLAYMAADSMRAEILIAQGYDVDIFEFISSRYTDKNTILRARYTGVKKEISSHYMVLKNLFQFEPALLQLIEGEPSREKEPCCSCESG